MPRRAPRLSRTAYWLVGALVVAAVIGGCAPKAEEVRLLQPVRISLYAGAVFDGGESVLVGAEGERLLLYHEEQWDQLPLPTTFGKLRPAQAGFATFSVDGRLVTTPFEHATRGHQELYTCSVHVANWWVWEGSSLYHPFRPVVVAVGHEGHVLHTLSALHRQGQPGRYLRLAYDFTDLSERAVHSVGMRVQKVAQAPLPENLDAVEEAVRGALLSTEGPVWAVASHETVYRWTPATSEVVEQVLSPEAAGEQMGSEQAARGARAEILQTAPKQAAFAAYWGEGSVFVWRIPVSGEAQFVGTIPVETAEGRLERLMPGPDGEQWAEVRAGGAGSSLYVTAGVDGEREPVPVSSPDPRDPVWSPEGDKLFFVAAEGELWVRPAGAAARLVSKAPPVAALVRREAPIIHN